MLRSWVLSGRRVNALVKSVQRGTIAMGGGSTSSATTITSVDTNNALLHYLGASETTGGSADGFAYVTLTNSTTVTAARANGGGTNTVSFEVIEYWPGVIKSVQRGTVTTASVSSNTATITAVTLTRSVVEFLGNSTSDNASGNSSNWFTRLALTNATTVTATVQTATNTQVTSYQVVEWM